MGVFESGIGRGREIEHAVTVGPGTAVYLGTYAVSEAYIAQVLHAVEADQINWEQRLAGTGPVRSKGLAPPVRPAYNQLQGPDQHAHPPFAIASHLWDRATSMVAPLRAAI